MKLHLLHKTLSPTKNNPNFFLRKNMASSSLIFSSLTLIKTSSSIKQQLHVPRFSSSFPFVQSSIKLSRNKNSSSSRFVLKVYSVSSESDQDEEVLSSGDDEAVDRSPPSDCKLFVGNLPFNVDSATLAGLFEQAGIVEMVEVIYDKITGRSRGFGFVTMSSTTEVEAAAQQFNGYELEGRPLRVNYGPPPPKDFSAPRSPRGETGGYGSREGPGYGGRGGSSFDSSNRLYVGNLSWGVDDMALEQLFSEQGNVKEARVVYDRETGRSRGFGFVTYSSADEVNKAIESLDGTDLDGRSIRVSVAESKPKRF